MKRAALERIRTKSTWARHQRLNCNALGLPLTAEVGRFRKSLRVGGCGNSECWLCHAGKLSGDPSLAERRSDLTFAEGLAESLRSNRLLKNAMRQAK